MGWTLFLHWEYFLYKVNIGWFFTQIILLPHILSGAWFVRSLVFCVLLILFSLTLLVIALPVLLRLKDSDYPFGIFKFFIEKTEWGNLEWTIQAHRKQWTQDDLTKSDLQEAGAAYPWWALGFILLIGFAFPIVFIIQCCDLLEKTEWGNLEWTIQAHRKQWTQDA
jgi:hypothetical protein